MTRVEEFNGFYAATSRQVIQVTYAVCGDRQVALESTVNAFRHAWRDWSKVRDDNPLGYVRTEAWRQTGLVRGTHPLRRKSEEDSDQEILKHLAGMTAVDRRLLALMTLGDIDLDEASREIGIAAEVGIENVTTAIATLESELGLSIDDVERRLQGLGAMVETPPLPTASQIRKSGTRGRQRNTAALVAAVFVAIVASGFVVAEGDAFSRSASLPERQKLGAEDPVILEAQKVDASQLLTVEQVQRLNPSADWTIVETDQDPSNTTPYATCPTERFANANPQRVFVRTYKSNAAGNERVAQSIEVAADASTASAAYRQLLDWYSNCSQPRVQLVGAWTVERSIGDFKIIRLRSHRSPVRTFTVGFSHSGTVTSTLVHEIDKAEGPDIESFARALNDSVSRVCVASGGNCTSEISVGRAIPPATSQDPGFLGIVDLPPIAKVDKVWAATDAQPFEKNLAATQCDQATFDGKRIEKATSKTFLIPGAKVLPKQFGLIQTVATFSEEKDAKRYARGLIDKVENCPDDNLSADITQQQPVKSTNYQGATWRISFEVAEDQRVYYRTGIVRRGKHVTQLTFTSAKGFQIGQDPFVHLAYRAGQRMSYLD